MYFIVLAFGLNNILFTEQLTGFKGVFCSFGLCKRMFCNLTGFKVYFCSFGLCKRMFYNFTGFKVYFVVLIFTKECSVALLVSKCIL